MLLALLLAAAQPVPPAEADVAFGVPYDAANPFARILRGALPAVRVWEDRDVLVFMDAHPRAPGHVLVIAKRSTARNALEMKPSLYGRLMRVAQRMVAAEVRAFGAAGVVVQQNNGIAQSVPHLHVHVVPVYAGQTLAPPETTGADPTTLAEQAARLRAAMR